jgi:hypothetical protein
MDRIGRAPRAGGAVNASLQEVRSRNLRTIALLAAIFLIPLVAAFGMYYGGGWRPAASTNHGELIHPARPLPRIDAAYPATTFTHAWSLVYIGAGDCDDSCRNALYVMRQTRLALNNDMNRVQRVFVATAGSGAGEFLAREQAGLVVIDATGHNVQALLEQFPDTERARTIFVVDPLGNLMMRFDARANPRGLREDLVKLLKLSHIG